MMQIISRIVIEQYLYTGENRCIDINILQDQKNMPLLHLSGTCGIFGPPISAIPPFMSRVILEIIGCFSSVF